MMWCRLEWSIGPVLIYSEFVELHQLHETLINFRDQWPK